MARFFNILEENGDKWRKLVENSGQSLNVGNVHKWCKNSQNPTIPPSISDHWNLLENYLPRVRALKHGRTPSREVTSTRATLTVQWKSPAPRSFPHTFCTPLNSLTFLHRARKHSPLINHLYRAHRQIQSKSKNLLLILYYSEGTVYHTVGLIKHSQYLYDFERIHITN